MTAPNRYHHGDLRPTLLREAAAMIRDGGLETLSLRKLGDRAGVSAASLYHHFRDKNDLLCALAEAGFAELARVIDGSTADVSTSVATRFRELGRAYIHFATTNPETYDLMFGRTIWKVGTPTPALRDVAYGAFRRYVENVDALVEAIAPHERASSLRFAKASWAMLHGLCRLRIDGIYIDSGDLDSMTDEAARFVLARLGVAS